MRVAWFQGDVNEPYDGEAIPPPPYSLEQLLALPRDHEHAPRLRVLLVPDDADTSDLWGDDWNDAPADCNAGEPYENRLPPGSRWVTLYVGDLVTIGEPSGVV